MQLRCIAVDARDGGIAYIAIVRASPTAWIDDTPIAAPLDDVGSTGFRWQSIYSIQFGAGGAPIFYRRATGAIESIILVDGAPLLDRIGSIIQSSVSTTFVSGS